jgi:nucleoside phosphorylase
MAYRTPADVKDEFRAHPRRALILTTVVHESRAVNAHLTNLERLIGENSTNYEYGLFADPAGDWLVVHALTAPGNSDAGLVASKAHQEFGRFDAQMFVGIAGSLKEDIGIGSVVIGDYVYNAHSAKVEDQEVLARSHSIPAARDLLTAAQALILSGEWTDLIRSPVSTPLPATTDYPKDCVYPPEAMIKAIASGEEVVAGVNSPRAKWFRTHLNDAGAVEMEGWGVMNAAHHENTPAIIVRGISDMCAGKDHEKDKLHQPIASAHAAAFAFSILSFRSKVPTTKGPVMVSETKESTAAKAAESPPSEERRVEFVFNFEGSKGEWSDKKVESVVKRLKQAIDDEKLTLVRTEDGSIRLVMSVRESDIAVMDLAKIRDAVADSGATLLGATPLKLAREAEKAKKALAAASVSLLAWEKTLPNGKWMERPEQDKIEARFQLDTSSTVLLGEPGSGKSALLSKIASDLIERGAAVFALKADFLPTDVRTESDLQHDLQLAVPPSELILRLAALQPVFIFIDQLDALASQLDLRSGRLNVLLNMVRHIGSVPNVHVLLSARTFEFNHDVRLKAVGAEAITLALPPWHEVKERLAEVGIDPDAWPEKVRDVVRIPQALKTFIALVRAGRSEPLTTYQAMLEQLWRDRIASAADSESLIALASDLAGIMAEEESLWLAASRFDKRLNALKRLEAVGFIVRSENGLSVAFSHQTIFDYVLARTFVGSVGLLSKYVTERQDSLFVRAKVWSALNYLREAEARSYERELLEIWKVKNLRCHLRLLLIEFLGQVSEPFEFEKVCMAEVLNAPELRIFGLKAIGSSSGWFHHFASTAIREAMSGTSAEASQAVRIIALNWKTDSDRVIRLIKDHWLPYPEKDNYSWMAADECPLWTHEVEEIATTILKRSPISVWQVNHVAITLAVEQPDVAMRLVLTKLDFLLAEAKSKPGPPPFPENGTKDEKTSWYIEHGRSKEFDRLLDAMEWHDFPSLAEAAPAVFLRYLWRWYVSVFSEILARSENRGVKHIYPGQYILEIELAPSGDRSASREKPIMSALQAAIEELAVKTPDDFSMWADENSNLEILAVQQLIARGYEVASDKLASKALEWILLDQRRFQLGTIHGHRHTTIDLLRASASYWSREEIGRFEKAVLNYNPPVPDHLKESEQRKLFADLVRATKKDLLQAVGLERLAPENRELVATEQRALGNRFDRSISEVKGGFIGSPMQATAMCKAKDRDILKIFREIPDNTNWNHPTHWMRGGNIQLSRAFAEFAKSNPDRAIRIMEQFEPCQQERAAGYALDAMADDERNDSRVIEALVDLHARRFQTEELRESAARAVEKIASRKADIGDEVIGILVEWLTLSPAPSEEEVKEDIDLTSRAKDEDLKEGSILWGNYKSFFLPGGNYNTLSALASILLNRKESGRDRYLVILDDHFSREHDPNIWKALLHRLSNAGGSTPQIVSTFLRKLFARFPEILATQEAVMFLAYAQNWDDQFVLDLISDWRKSDQAFLQRAYGELVGLVAIVKEKNDWVQARDEIMASGTDEMKIGLAHAALNMWSDEELRQRTGNILVTLLKGASKELVAAVMDIFRVTDELTPDASTVELLRALTDAGTDMSAAPSHFVVERLQALLPFEPELIATIGEKLVAAWRGELGDIRTSASLAAPQLTDLALTLHRLGGASRQSGISIFEAMIEIDAYGARATLAEIDGRFGPHQAATRQRLARRRRPRASGR